MRVSPGLKNDVKTYKIHILGVRKSNNAGLVLVWCGLLALLILWGSVAFADTSPVDIDKLADSIYLAEGGSNTKHPYGILAKYKTTTPRQACINTIKSGLKRYSTYTGKDDYIVFLSKTYCPIGAKNDPTGLNKNWVKNVKFYYNKALSKGAK